MKDSSEQTNTQPAYASQPSELRERLLRALTEPAGVIDVRYAQRKYARIAEWLDKRAELLQQLQTRYGVGEGIADDNQPLLMNERPGEPVHFHSTAAQAFSIAQYFSTAQPPSTAGQSIFAAEQSATPATADQSLSSAELTHPFAESVPTPISSGEAPTTYASLRVTDLSQLPEGEFRVSRRRAPFNPSLVPPALPLADTPARAQAASTEPDGSESVAARDANASQQHASDASSRVAPRATAREVVQTESIQTAPPVSTPALPLAYARPAVSSAEAVDGAGRTSRRSTETATSAKGERESVVAEEIKDDSFTRAGPEIIWRKGQHDDPATGDDSRGPSNGDDGGATSNARQVGGHSAERTAQQATPISSSAKGHEQGDEIRIEQLSPRVIHTISEKVMRAISRDLAIELERRGLRKWR